MVFRFYVPRLDAASASVINPASGAEGLSCNNASITGGTWTPVDVRDAAVDFAVTPYDPAGCEHTLADKSLAIQKSVTDLSGGIFKPGSVLEYRLTFQVSDFFAFNGLSVTDLLSDGQHVLASFTPTLCKLAAMATPSPPPPSARPITISPVTTPAGPARNAPSTTRLPMTAPPG